MHAEGHHIVYLFVCQNPHSQHVCTNVQSKHKLVLVCISWKLFLLVE